MFYITSYQGRVTNYDFDQIEDFRFKGRSWRSIAKYYSVVHPAVFNWHKRYLKAAKENYTPPINDEFYVPHKADHDDEGLGAYGTIEPTGLVSDLNNDDWIQKYCGFTWKAEYLTEMRDRIWFTQKLLLLTFRFGGKTTTMACLFLRWLLEKHQPIVCFGNPEKLSDIFYLITELIESDLIRTDYGDVVARRVGYKIWLVTSMRKADDGSPLTDPNLSLSGKLSTSIGKHTGDGGWLHLEDLWQESKVSPEAERRSRRWLARTIRYMKGRNTKFTMTGTRKDVDDAYQYAIDKLYFPVLRQQALVIEEGRLPSKEECEVDHEKEIITKYPAVGTYIIHECPRWPIENLLYEFLYHDMDAEAELNNNPLPPSGRFFNGADWIEVPTNPEDGPNYMMVDPAFGQSSTASKTAIIILCISPTKFTIVDAYIGRLGLDAKADMVVDFHERNKPFQTLMEDNFRQITTRYAPDHKMMRLRGLSMVESFDNKRHRIEALRFPYTKREWQIVATCPYKNEIKAEYLTYSQEDSDAVVRVKYNALDAMSMGYLKLKHFMRSSVSRIKIEALGRRF